MIDYIIKTLEEISGWNWVLDIKSKPTSGIKGGKWYHFYGNGCTLSMHVDESGIALTTPGYTRVQDVCDMLQLDLHNHDSIKTQLLKCIEAWSKNHSYYGLRLAEDCEESI